MIAARASASWQTGFAKADGLRIDSFDSPALGALAAALSNDDVLGLTVQFNTYGTVYYNQPALLQGSPQHQAAMQALHQKLVAGGFQPNPARSTIVGVIALWRRGESDNQPSDRALVQSDSRIGTAHARLTGRTLAIDLSSAIPETGKALDKADLGVLSVVAVDGATQAITPLGPIPSSQYNKAAYEAAAGIISLTLTPAAATAAVDADLQIRNSLGAVLLAERAQRVLPLTPNLYLDEGDAGSATFQVYNRGAPATTEIPVTVYSRPADGGPVASIQLTSDANGVLTVPIPATAAGVTLYVASPGNPDSELGDGLDPQADTYMTVRILPADADVAALSPTWSNVYDRVLANWNAMAPCMDNWLMLDDPAQVTAFGRVLKRLTDPKNFEGFRFMPVTRDMTKGERALLYKFLDAPAPTVDALDDTIAPSSDFDALSRSMRAYR
jgi:hypothetical protein